MRLFLLVLFSLVLVACGDDDAAIDGGRDAASDGEVIQDAPVDVLIRDAVADTPSDLPAVLDVPDAPVSDIPLDTGPPVDPFEGMGSIEVALGERIGDAYGFLEGPHWKDGRLYFTDQFFDDPERTAVYALTPPSDVAIIVQPSDGANGLATNGEGDLIACLQAGRRIARVTEGATETLFDRYDGARFNAPNDLVFRADGTWFFTDPGYGAEVEAELEARSVFYVDGTTLRPVWDGTRSQRPNGITLSPDESILYLADTADGIVRAFDVAADGTLSGEREFATVDGPDGMTVDAAGNLYVTTSEGIEVFAPDGSAWGIMRMRMRPSNCGFGDADRQTLYITARTTLYRVRMPVAGVEGR